MTDSSRSAIADADIESLTIIISDAYRARHGMPALGVAMAVDRDIAEAILTTYRAQNTDLQVLNEAVDAAEKDYADDWTGEVPLHTSNWLRNYTTRIEEKRTKENK